MTARSIGPAIDGGRSGRGLTRSAHRGIVLQKSFRGADREFLEPLVRFMRGDARAHIGSSEIDHGPP